MQPLDHDAFLKDIPEATKPLNPDHVSHLSMHTFMSASSNKVHAAPKEAAQSLLCVVYEITFTPNDDEWPFMTLADIFEDEDVFVYGPDDTMPFQGWLDSIKKAVLTDDAAFLKAVQETTIHTDKGSLSMDHLRSFFSTALEQGLGRSFQNKWTSVFKLLDRHNGFENRDTPQGRALFVSTLLDDLSSRVDDLQLSPAMRHALEDLQALTQWDDTVLWKAIKTKEDVNPYWGALYERHELAKAFFPNPSTQHAKGPAFV
jgi:hypothetical protein